jgi:flavodoxin
MKSLILFYSHSGNTKAIAQKKAAETGADIEEIIEVKKPFMLTGILRAMKRKKTEIKPVNAQPGNYDKIIIMAPIWAGYPVSAINSVIEILPKDKEVEVIMVSGGGGSKKSAEGTKALIVKQGCRITGYTDLQAKRKNNEVTAEIIK